MTFDILQFKEQGLRYGGARPCLFQVTLGQALDPADQYNPNALADFPFLVKAASLPSMVVSPIRVPYFGRHIKVAGNRDFEDWTITVFNDEDWNFRDMFEDWSNTINSLQGNLRTPSDLESAYKSDVLVQQFDKQGNIIRGYNMLGAWPARISQIDLDWEAQNQIEVFQVMFSYDYWLPDSTGVAGVASTASYTGQ